ncbi:MAG TPA: TetR/AcrR family transcriptional regulator [Candidatus Dormibacteraeota bacterium]|nr:TetR/AcrR family transcriptional regulator [Candidatus Dormibacteraeota bacterium]
MTLQAKRKLAPPRPRRGSPQQTRDRLVAAAAILFNRAGYHGTDSNRIAKAAGYSTGVFYKHFKDKREIFLAAYETWVASQWKEVEKVLFAGGSNRDIARQLVALSIDFHTRWRGLRSSLRELVFSDATVRRFYRKQRKRQLDLMAELRKKRQTPSHRREEDVIHLYTTERTYDAIAQGELRELGLSRKFVVEAMVQDVISVLT